MNKLFSKKQRGMGSGWMLLILIGLGIAFVQWVLNSRPSSVSADGPAAKLLATNVIDYFSTMSSSIKFMKENNIPIASVTMDSNANTGIYGAGGVNPQGIPPTALKPGATDKPFLIRGPESKFITPNGDSNAIGLNNVTDNVCAMVNIIANGWQWQGTLTNIVPKGTAGGLNSVPAPGTDPTTPATYNILGTGAATITLTVTTSAGTPPVVSSNLNFDPANGVGTAIKDSNGTAVLVFNGRAICYKPVVGTDNNTLIYLF